MSVRCDASYVFDKGLSNYRGHNNCFLNSAIQVLWHLDVFRKNFLALRHHYCIYGSCIYCSLQEIFKEFKESEEDVLHPDMMRVTLASTFEDQMKFQLGELDDASECYENILSKIHFHLCQDIQDDCCSLKHCLTHKKFAMFLIEQSECLCGSTSEPLSYTQLVHFVSTHAIVNISSKGKLNNFGKILKLAFHSGFSGSCSVKCGLTSRVTHTLANLPDVISIGLIWESSQSDPIQIKDFVSIIQTSINLEDLFDKVVEGSGQSQRDLVGVVCYYLKHYSTFFFHSRKKTWISFDDASVTEIGRQWSSVVDKCCKGKYQPLLLIYQNSNASLIEMSTAPSVTTCIDKQYLKEFGINKKMRMKCTGGSLDIQKDSLLGAGGISFDKSGNYVSPQIPRNKIYHLDYKDALHQDESHSDGQHSFSQEMPLMSCSKICAPRQDQTNRVEKCKSENSILTNWTLIDLDNNADVVCTKRESLSIYDSMPESESRPPDLSLRDLEYLSIEEVYSEESLAEKSPCFKNMEELDEIAKRDLFAQKVKAMYR